MQRLSSAAPDDTVRSIVNELAVEPIQVAEGSLDRYAREQLGRARERVLTKQIEELRSRMQRLESEDPAAQADVFAAGLSGIGTSQDSRGLVRCRLRVGSREVASTQVSRICCATVGPSRSRAHSRLGR